MKSTTVYAYGSRVFWASFSVCLVVGCSSPVTTSDVPIVDVPTDISTDTATDQPQQPDQGLDVSTDTQELPDVQSDTGMETSTPAMPIAHWELPRTGPNRFLLPWPNDVTKNTDGSVNLRFIPNSASPNSLILDYQNVMPAKLRGFSTIGATYFRFSTPIDRTTLPANATASVTAQSSVQIINLDTRTRHPAQWYFRETPTRYWTPNTLAVAPAFGFPLRGATRYAIVITNSARSTQGAYLRDADLLAVLGSSGGDATVTSTRSAYASALTDLEMSGINRDQILSLAVFTTQDPTAEMFRVADHVSQTPAPNIVSVRLSSMTATTHTYTGQYGPSPNYQAGVLPYSTLGEGDFVFDQNNQPVVQGLV